MADPRLSHLPAIKWAQPADKVLADIPSQPYVSDGRHNGVLVACTVSNLSQLRRLS